MVRAKVYCFAVHDYGTNREVQLRPVYDANPKSPNHVWSKATPGGEIKLNISNPGAFGQFMVGQHYFIDFHPCEKDAVDRHEWTEGEP